MFFLDQAYSPKWPDVNLVLFLRFLCTSNSSRSIKTQPKNSANNQPSWPHAWSIRHINTFHADPYISLFAIVFSLCRRSLLSLYKPEWSQSKQNSRNIAIWTSVAWHPTEGWYRFVGTTGTKMLTTRVPAFRCGTDWPAGWLVGSDPTMEDDEVHKTFCFSNRNSSCKYYEKYKIKDIKRKKTRKRKQKNRKYWYSGQTDHHFARPLTR